MEPVRGIPHHYLPFVAGVIGWSVHKAGGQAKQILQTHSGWPDVGVKGCGLPASLSTPARKDRVPGAPVRKSGSEPLFEILGWQSKTPGCAKRLALGYWGDGWAALSCRITRTNPEQHIVLGYGKGSALFRTGWTGWTG
jgi:hypothetical protein